LDIGAGDEVIVPAHTFIASWLAVSQVGAKIVPVEPDPHTCNITAEGIASAISPKTKAIMVVHLYGQPCAMDAISALAKSKGLYLIEDCAQAHGAKWQGQPVGSFGDISAFSFYPVKNLGALGEAGAVCTNNPEIADRIIRLRNYGQSEKYYYQEMGSNERMDELQAAFLNVKLDYLAHWTELRRTAAHYYLEALADVPDLILPKALADADHVWHLFTIQHPRRDALQKHLADKGIDTMIHYPVPAHLQKAYAHLGYQKGDFPISEALADSLLSLPLYPGMEEKEMDLVVEGVRSY
jgi:dTDP-4-amino-4,6-dideoxygalactose transaminase